MFCQDAIIVDNSSTDEPVTVRAVDDDDDDLDLPGDSMGAGDMEDFDAEDEEEEEEDVNVNVVGASDEARARVIPDRDYPYLSPLAVAVFARQLDVVAVLLKFDADPTRKDGSSLTPYERCLLQVCAWCCGGRLAPQRECFFLCGQRMHPCCCMHSRSPPSFPLPTSLPLAATAS